jgi:hypothetical protein
MYVKTLLKRMMKKIYIENVENHVKIKIIE